MHNKDPGMVIVMILKKQENHLPRLKDNVKEEFQAYPTPSLFRKNTLS